MSKVFAGHEIVKPAEVIESRSLKMTSRVGDVTLSKSRRKREEAAHPDMKHAQETVAAIQKLKEKEKALEQEEDLAN